MAAVPIAQAAHAKRGQVIAVPGSAVALLTLDLPDRLRGVAREQVARRQMRDRLGLSADEVEMRPFRAVSKQAWTQVLVADTDLVRQWRETAGRRQPVILPDYLTLTTAPDVWTVFSGQDGVAVRLGPGNGFGAAKDVARVALAAHLSDADQRPKAILALGEAWPELVELAQAHDVPLVSNIEDLIAIDGVEAPSAFQNEELSCNLLHDPALIRDQLRAKIMPWRWPTAICAIAITLWATSDILETQRLRDERAAIQQSTQQIVREVFVPEGPILDIRSQVLQAEQTMRQDVTAESTPTSALALFEQAGPVVFGARARTLRASSPDGTRLDLLLETADFAAADALTDALVGEGLDVRVVSSRRGDEGNAVRTEVQLRPAESDGQP
mmetsp:Transcript_23981/g.43861  ORF Transcript_23981/g.43861 Transcript_23981/m.43861 type:complete len:385 (-) Transcript_23981:1043-2197(-)